MINGRTVSNIKNNYLILGEGNINLPEKLNIYGRNHCRDTIISVAAVKMQDGCRAGQVSEAVKKMELSIFLLSIVIRRTKRRLVFYVTDRKICE